MSTIASRVAQLWRRHPYWCVGMLAFVARVAVAGVVRARSGGTLFYDDVTYWRMAGDLANGTTDTWNGPLEILYDATRSFLWPLRGAYELGGGEILVGQLLVVGLGVASALLVTRLAAEVLPPCWAGFGGAVVALLPSMVLWSSITLKDVVSWVALATVGIAVARANDADAPRALLGPALVVVAAFVVLANLRDHTLVVAAWSVAIASFLGSGALQRQRVVGALAMVVVVPLLLGLGPAGARVVLDAGSLADRRAANEVNAETALGGEASLLHLPRGLVTMTVEPLPWQATKGNSRLVLAKIETLVWYPILALALFALPAAWRRRSSLAFPALCGGGLLVMYALVEGNFGTAYRHRGEFVWAVAVFSAVGARQLASRLSERSS